MNEALLVLRTLKEAFFISYYLKNKDSIIFIICFKFSFFLCKRLQKKKDIVIILIEKIY